MTDISEIRGKVDFGIITIRPDEFEAVLRFFEVTETVEGVRRYALSAIETDQGSEYVVAVARAPHQGFSYAQQTAEAMISDLDPQWLLLVGIGGGVPDNEFTLGDVILGARFIDYSVQAAVQDKPTEFDFRGLYSHPQVEDLLALLPAVNPLKGWTKSIKLPTPPVTVQADRMTGDEAWQKKIETSLTYHFPSGVVRERTFLPGTIGTSNTLVKDSDLVQFLSKTARSIIAFEMEAGGVMVAARRKDREYPVLCIRGISDIVCYKREGAWTSFACESAAAFTHALLKTGIVVRPRNPSSLRAPKTGTGKVPTRVIPSGFELKSVHTVEKSPYAAMGDVKWAPVGSRVAAVVSNRVVFVDSNSEAFEIEGHTGAISNLSWSPEGRFIAGGSAGGGVNILDSQERTEVGRLTNESSWNIGGVAWSSTGDLIASAQGNEIYMWEVAVDSWGNLTRGTVKCVLRGHKDKVVAVAFAPKGDLLASSSNDKTVQIWRIGESRPIAKLKTNEEWVWDLAWLPDGTQLMYRGDSLGIWNMVSAPQILEKEKSVHGSISFSGDGQLLAYLIKDSVHFKERSTLKVVGQLEPIATHINVQQVAFAPHGYSFAICGPSKGRPHNDQLQVWDLADWRRSERVAGDTTV